MPNKYPEKDRSETNISTSISMEKSLMVWAKARAKDRELDFSKYVRWLIKKDRKDRKELE